MIAVWSSVAIGCAYLLALAGSPAFGLRPVSRAWATTGVIVLVLLSPFIIPAEARFPRVLAAMNAVALAAKLYDFHLTAYHSPRPRFGAFILYLPNWFSLVWRRIDD